MRHRVIVWLSFVAAGCVGTARPDVEPEPIVDCTQDTRRIDGRVMDELPTSATARLVEATELTEAEERRAYASVRDSLRNLYGPGVEYFTRQIWGGEMLPDGADFHPGWFADTMAATERFSELCRSGARQRCDPPAAGIEYMIGRLHGDPCSDSLFVAVVQVTVYPASAKPTVGFMAWEWFGLLKVFGEWAVVSRRVQLIS